MRGDEIPDLVSARKSIGHSHVLPPDSREPDNAWPILCKLLHKACERLRSHGLLTGSLSMQLAFLGGQPWATEIKTPETDSTIALMRLCEHSNYTPPLCQVVTDTTAANDTEKQRQLDTTLDKLRARYGRRAVYFGGVQESRDEAPMRISFTHIPDLEVERD